MKHIDAAMERLKQKTVKNEKDLSLVERILANEPDPKTAYILALDLILVGIDTVCDNISSDLVYLSTSIINFQISMAICSILYQLATRPEQQEKLYRELRRVLPNRNEPLTSEKLDEMVFLKAFVKEVFR